MPKKPVGGRGKRENYSTTVIRVPLPILAEVLFLIEQFHKERKAKKPVADLKEPRSRYRQMHIEEFLDINPD